MADSLPRRARRGGRMRFRDASSTASWLRKRGKAKGPALSRQSRSELALCFSMIDEDDNGAIDADELRVAFAALGVDATRAQCVAEIARVDRDRSGTIQLPEFVTLVTSLDASSGRDGAISRTPRRVEAVRRLTAGADADTDARVVLAEAGVGPDGQGMERALADARARVGATGMAGIRGAARRRLRTSVPRRRNAPIGLTALAFQRRTSIARVVDVPSRVRALAREDARATSASRRAEAAARAAGKRRGEPARTASREAFSRGRVVFASRGLGIRIVSGRTSSSPRGTRPRRRTKMRTISRPRGVGRGDVAETDTRRRENASDFGRTKKRRRVVRVSRGSARRHFLSRVRGLARSADARAAAMRAAIAGALRK